MHGPLHQSYKATSPAIHKFHVMLSTAAVTGRNNGKKHAPVQAARNRRAFVYSKSNNIKQLTNETWSGKESAAQRETSCASLSPDLDRLWLAVLKPKPKLAQSIGKDISIEVGARSWNINLLLHASTVQSKSPYKCCVHSGGFPRKRRVGLARVSRPRYV